MRKPRTRLGWWWYWNKFPAMSCYLTDDQFSECVRTADLKRQEIDDLRWLRSWRRFRWARRLRTPEARRAQESYERSMDRGLWP